MINDRNKFVIVFDIDGVICKPPLDSEFILDDPKYIDKFQQLHPECPDPIIFNYKEELYFHFFPPYLNILFDYLINCNCRIAFFSAGMKARNIELIEHLLTNILGNERYQELKEANQFTVFSKDSLNQEQKKDIAIILNAYEDPNNSVLIEDQPENATYNTPCILAISLFTWDLWQEDNASIKCLPKSTVYYLLGVFISYFNQERIDNITLKDWLEYKKLPNNRDCIENMIKLGLQEVQKQYHNAIFYGEELFTSNKLTNPNPPPTIKF